MCRLRYICVTPLVLPPDHAIIVAEYDIRHTSIDLRLCRRQGGTLYEISTGNGIFLTGATALSMSTTALAADLPDNVDITVSTTQTADEQENNLYTKNDKDLTDAEFEQKYELPENSWFTPAVPLCD